MKYTADLCEVRAGKKVIAKAYLTNTGYEVFILQGMNRKETIKKIIQDCPQYANEYRITENYYPKLFNN